MFEQRRGRGLEGVVVTGLFSWPSAGQIDEEGAELPASEDAFRARFNGDFGDTLGLDGVKGIAVGCVLENLAERTETLPFDLSADEEGVRGVVEICWWGCGEDGLSIWVWGR
ncbi:hypothetical protein IMZ48_30445 [Candidatus Bathyarchaeota archaeon]|nr:hypothetical protein [Candidatus Bathyarchaeota archaeon]